MKPLFTFLILLVSVLTCYSQTPLSKGKLFLSGNFGVGNSESESTTSDLPNYKSKSTSKSISISPIIGLFVNSQTVIGLSTSYGNSLEESYSINDNYNSSEKVKFNHFAIGPIIRHYVPLGGRFAFFGQGNASIALSKYKKETFTNNPQQVEKKETDKYTSFVAGIRSGIAVFVTKRFSFESSLDLASFNYRKTENSKGFSLSVIPLSSISVGVAWYLGKDNEQ